MYQLSLINIETRITFLSILNIIVLFYEIIHYMETEKIWEYATVTNMQNIH